MSVVADTSKHCAVDRGYQCLRPGASFRSRRVAGSLQHATRDNEGAALARDQSNQETTMGSIGNTRRKVAGVAAKKVYSSRNATTGSTVAARREGT
jgi:hypothetical protein